MSDCLFVVRSLYRSEKVKVYGVIDVGMDHHSAKFLVYTNSGWFWENARSFIPWEEDEDEKL